MNDTPGSHQDWPGPSEPDPAREQPWVVKPDGYLDLPDCLLCHGTGKHQIPPAAHPPAGDLHPEMATPHGRALAHVRASLSTLALTAGILSAAGGTWDDYRSTVRALRGAADALDQLMPAATTVEPAGRPIEAEFNPGGDQVSSQVDSTDPSWYPRFLKELEAKYPLIYEEITSAVVTRNAQDQVKKGK